MDYKRNLSTQQEISFFDRFLMDEGNCSRFLNFCERIIYKLSRHFHDENEADLQEVLISVILTNLATCRLLHKPHLVLL